MRPVTGDGIGFSLTVPGTDRALQRHGARLVDPAGTVEFSMIEPGIWDLTPPDRRPALDRFAERYAAVRSAEGRELAPEANRRLPGIDPAHPLAGMWRQRAESYHHLLSALTRTRAGRVVDVGAGSGWLAARLAERGWTAAAIDVTIDGGDGLARACDHGACLFLARAEMEALPFAARTVDLVVFNASLHYASDIAGALFEAKRVLRSGGTIAVLDSPVFADVDAGRQSVAEFADHVRATHQLEPAPLAGPGFVSEAELAAFEAVAGCDWERSGDDTGVRGRYRAWRGARIAGRETATRPLLIARLPEQR